MNGYNFTEHVRASLARAREESAALGHEYVGTEHILLGLIRERNSVGCVVMQNMEVDLQELRAAVIEIVKPGRVTHHRHDLPYTSRAKKSLELAMSEARGLNHSYVGTEHLLLGILREQKGVAAQALNDFGVELDRARAEVLRVRGDGASDSASRWDSPPDRTRFPRYPKRLNDVLALSHGVAGLCKTLTVTGAHVAIALLEHGEGIANAALDRLGFNRDVAIAALAGLAPIGDVTIGPDDVMHSSPRLITALDEMDQIQREMRATAPGTHHLLLGILNTSPDVAAVFAAQSVDVERLRDEIRRISG